MDLYKVFPKYENEGFKEHLREYISVLFADLYNEPNAAIPPDLLEDYYEMAIEGTSDSAFLSKLLSTVASQCVECLAVVIESSHVDSGYRETYYSYFSKKHFNIERFSIRLSFYDYCGDRDEWNNASIDTLQSAFIGSCVLNSVNQGTIGKTLINPSYLIDADVKAYLRLSSFKVNVFGRPFLVSAFPFCRQDCETMRCAEVTLLNILSYYSNEFSDYRSVGPGDIKEIEASNSHERVLPSRGINYFTLSKILVELGFSPRLYRRDYVLPGICAEISKSVRFNRILHYYIESGIPVAINTSPEVDFLDGHSLVCIGHTEPKQQYIEKAQQTRLEFQGVKGQPTFSILNTADFFDRYIVIDDNQLPYSVRHIDELTVHSGMVNMNYLVPLHRSMLLDCMDAYDKFIAVFADDRYGIHARASSLFTDKDSSENVDIIVRMYLASSKSFKRHRVNTLSYERVRSIYESMPLPHFIWVCELYTEEGYCCDDLEKRAFAEIVIDATSAAVDYPPASIILMNFPNSLDFRYPEKIGDDLMARMEIEDGDTTKGALVPFTNNLTAGLI